MHKSHVGPMHIMWISALNNRRLWDALC